MEIDTSSLINIIVVLIIGCGGICSFLIWRHDRTKIALKLRRKLQQNLIELMRLSELYTEVRDNAQSLNEVNRKLNSVKDGIEIIENGKTFFWKGLYHNDLNLHFQFVHQ